MGGQHRKPILLPCTGGQHRRATWRSTPQAHYHCIGGQHRRAHGGQHRKPIIIVLAILSLAASTAESMQRRTPQKTLRRQQISTKNTYVVYGVYFEFIF